MKSKQNDKEMIANLHFIKELNKTILNGKCRAFKDDGKEDIFAARRAAESLV